MNDLEIDEIHLWLAFYEQITDVRLHAAYLKILDESERERQSRFRFSRDRLRYLVARALVRTVLSRYFPAVAPPEWIFSTNEYGRPSVANSSAISSSINFNLSHTCGLIALAVARKREVGIDVENVRTRTVSIDMANRFLAPEEVTALAQVPGELQRDRIFEYWTLKESYIKARGMGLSVPLEKLSFTYPDDRHVRIAIHADLMDDPQRWALWQFRPTPEYLLAVCAERLPQRVSRFVVRRVVPTQAEEVLTPALSRVSD